MKSRYFSFFAASNDIQLLVSPKTITASGFIFSNILSASIKILPIVVVDVEAAAFKK